MKSMMIPRSVLSLFVFAVLMLPVQSKAVTLLNDGEPMSAGIVDDLGISDGVASGIPGIDLYNDVQGVLSPFTQIVFTYEVGISAPDIFVPSQWIAGASGFSGTTSVTPWTNVIWDGIPVDNLFTADFTMTNATASTASFLADLKGPFFVDDPDGMVFHYASTTYTTAAVSNVPLPAALPLFGLGLAGLAAARRARSKKEVA